MTLKSVNYEWPIIGQHKLGRHLVKLLSKNNFPAVSIFAGPESLGKYTAARWLANFDLCLEEKSRPCGVCLACRNIQRDNYPPLTVIKNDTIKHYDIELLRSTMSSYRLITTDHRWLIVDQAEKMTEPAANTWLKFLEDPPPKLFIILITSQLDRLLPTIVSRAVVYRWHFVPAEVLQTMSPNPNVPIPIIWRSAGRPGWLINLLGQPNMLDQEISVGQQLKSARDNNQPISRRHHPNQSDSSISWTLMELWGREMMLQQLGARQRMLWLKKKPTLSEPAQSMSNWRHFITALMERYELSPNIQSQVLYDDLIMA